MRGRVYSPLRLLRRWSSDVGWRGKGPGLFGVFVCFQFLKFPLELFYVEIRIEFSYIVSGASSELMSKIIVDKNGII